MASFTFTHNTLSTAIVDVLSAGLVPFVKGSPAIGKSDTIRAVARALKLKVIDFRLAQCDPTDLNGYPKETNGRLVWVPPQDIPLETDEVPEGYVGWLLFMDEANSAPAAVQAAAYKITLDRMVGQHKLHEACKIVLAGNLDTDRAVTHRMSTALKSRLVHFTLEVNDKEFDSFILKNGWDDRIVAFLRFRPDLVWKFDPQTAEDTFPAPRTWEFLHRYLQALGGRKSDVAVMAGIVGEGTAVEFSTFIEMMEKCPTIEEIMIAPDTTAVPTEPSMQYAVSTMIGRKLDAQNIKTIVDYLNRLGVEFQVLAMRTAMAVTPQIKLTKEFMTWAQVRKNDIFGKD